MANEVYRFRFGAFDCWSVSDGEGEFGAEKYFANAPPEALRARLDRYNIQGDYVPTPLNCLLIRVGRRYALVDTGMGPRPGGNTGRLLTNLESIGVSRREVKAVICSHAHGDHMGNALDQNGDPTFPEARYYLSVAEWAYWVSKSSNASIRERLQSLSTALTLFDHDTLILPGIRAIAAPGHTPGQTALLIESGDERLLYTADIVAHPIHLEEPSWHIAADVDPVLALQSRRTLLLEAARNRWRLFVYHFPFPGIFRLLYTSDGFTLMPG